MQKSLGMKEVFGYVSGNTIGVVVTLARLHMHSIHCCIVTTMVLADSRLDNEQARQPTACNIAG